MAKPAKRKVPAGKATSRRVTPKGTSTSERPAPSSRYTPPPPRPDAPSPTWVPVLMFTLLGLGALTIFLNYLGVLPGATSNLYLGIGLVAICGGIITATQYR
ncbi:MAG TPA: cell division protein CrgA [Acidimicrobiales bacterium]